MELNNRIKIIITSVVSVLVIILIWWGMRPPASSLPPLDPYDHKSVAIHFIHENGKIGKKFGKVTSVSQIGDGGNVPESHNVFRVRGEDKGREIAGMCMITLKRGEDNEYVVTDVYLNIEGNEFKIPVQGFKDRGKGMNIFR